MKRLYAILFALALAACATVTTPQQTIYQIEADYTAAVNVATAYARLPRCGVGAVLCSQQALVDRLKAADNVAFNAITAARNTVTSPGAGANAQTALTAAAEATKALAAIAATLPPKP
jgi:hypothetical protein